jgi:hypothetical protein
VKWRWVPATSRERAIEEAQRGRPVEEIVSYPRGRGQGGVFGGGHQFVMAQVLARADERPCCSGGDDTPTADELEAMEEILHMEQDEPRAFAMDHVTVNLQDGSMVTWWRANHSEFSVTTPDGVIACVIKPTDSERNRLAELFSAEGNYNPANIKEVAAPVQAGYTLAEVEAALRASHRIAKGCREDVHWGAMLALLGEKDRTE